MRQNTTLIIIHSGNLEHICIRHRASQTLYISDILHVPQLKEPGYGKLQVGLYISAVDDAMRRVILEDTPWNSLPSGNTVAGVAQKPDGRLTKIKSSSKRARRSDRERPRKRGSGDSFRDPTDGESDGLQSDTLVSSSMRYLSINTHTSCSKLNYKPACEMCYICNYSTTFMNPYTQPDFIEVLAYLSIMTDLQVPQPTLCQRTHIYSLP